MLEIKELYKSYEKTEVLHGISLEVKPGEIHKRLQAEYRLKETL